MSQSESRTVAYLISSLVGTVLYFVYAIQQYQEGSFSSTTISSSWGIRSLGGHWYSDRVEHHLGDIGQHRPGHQGTGRSTRTI